MVEEVGLIKSFFPKAIDWGWVGYQAELNISLAAGAKKTLFTVDTAKKMGFNAGFIVGGQWISSTIYGGMHAKLQTPRGETVTIRNTPMGLNLMGLTSPTPGNLWVSKYNSGVTNFENVAVLCPSFYYPFKGKFTADIEETSETVLTIIRLLRIDILAVYEKD